MVAGAEPSVACDGAAGADAAPAFATAGEPDVALAFGAAVEPAAAAVADEPSASGIGPNSARRRVSRSASMRGKMGAATPSASPARRDVTAKGQASLSPTATGKR